MQCATCAARRGSASWVKAWSARPGTGGRWPGPSGRPARCSTRRPASHRGGWPTSSISDRHPHGSAASSRTSNVANARSTALVDVARGAPASAGRRGSPTGPRRTGAPSGRPCSRPAPWSHPTRTRRRPGRHALRAATTRSASAARPRARTASTPRRRSPTGRGGAAGIPARGVVRRAASRPSSARNGSSHASAGFAIRHAFRSSVAQPSGAANSRSRTRGRPARGRARRASTSSRRASWPASRSPTSATPGACRTRCVTASQTSSVTTCSSSTIEQARVVAVQRSGFGRQRQQQAVVLAARRSGRRRCGRALGQSRGCSSIIRRAIRSVILA